MSKHIHSLFSIISRDAGLVPSATQGVSISFGLFQRSRDKMLTDELADGRTEARAIDILIVHEHS